MAFSDEVEKASVNKFMLVRVEPARFISNLLADQGGGIYSLTFNEPISKVERNGTELTEVAGTPASNDEWSHDETTGLFQIKLASAPNDSTNVVVLFYYLFYTNGAGTYLNETPTNTSTTLRFWNPRLKTVPTITQTVKDVANGVLALSGSSISVLNPDNEFNQYLTTDDTFFNKRIRVWLVINSQIQLMFVGTITDIRFSSTTVSLNFVDSFSKLSEPALFGDTADDAYYLDKTGSFPNMDPSKSETPIPYVFRKSRTDRAISSSIVRVNEVGATQTLTSPSLSDTNKMLRSVCTDTTGTGWRGQNRSWGIARTGSHGFKTLNFGTVTSLVISSKVPATGDGDYYTYNKGATANTEQGNGTNGTFSERPMVQITTSGHNIEIGDSFKVTNIPTNVGTLPGFAVAMKVTNTSIEGMITDFTNGSNFIGPNQTVSIATSNLVTNQAPALVIKQGERLYFPAYEKDFTYTITTLNSGNKFMEIDFVGGFEITGCIDSSSDQRHVGMSTLDVNSEILFRVSTADSEDNSHANIVKQLLEKANLTVNAASITQANTDLSANGIFSIPYYDENDFSPYLSYLQNMLNSTLGYIYLDENFEAFYKLFKAPTSTDVRDESYIRKNSLKANINYQDMVNELVAFNPHNGITNESDTLDSSDTATNNKSKYLHDIGNTKRFRHLLDDITSRIDDILDYLSERQLSYTYEVASLDLDSNIGDDVQLETDKLLGTSSTQDVKIIGTQKNSDKVIVTVSDLFGL